MPTIDAEGSPGLPGTIRNCYALPGFPEPMHELAAQRADTEAAWAAGQGEIISMGLCRPH